MKHNQKFYFRNTLYVRISGKRMGKGVFGGAAFEEKVNKLRAWHGKKIRQTMPIPTILPSPRPPPFGLCVVKNNLADTTNKKNLAGSYSPPTTARGSASNFKMDLSFK